MCVPINLETVLVKFHCHPQKVFRFVRFKLKHTFFCSFSEKIFNSIVILFFLLKIAREIFWADYLIHVYLAIKNSLEETILISATNEMQMCIASTDNMLKGCGEKKYMKEFKTTQETGNAIQSM